MDINAENLQAVYTAVNTSFNKGFGSYDQLYQRIATVVQSTGAVEDYSWIGEFTELEEWIGKRQVKEMSAHNYSIKNKKFEGTESIKAEYVEDDKYGLLMPKFEMMGKRASQHPDRLIFELLKNGFTAQCYDKQNFFDTDHPLGDGVVSNIQAGTGEPWYLLDTTMPLKPLIFQNRRDYRLQVKGDPLTSDLMFMEDKIVYGVDARVAAGYGFWQQAYASKADLNSDNFDEVMANMMSLKSPEGSPLGITPDLLVVGPKNRSKAQKAVAAEYKAGGESNTNFKAVEVLVVPWLA